MMKLEETKAKKGMRKGEESVERGGDKGGKNLLLIISFTFTSKAINALSLLTKKSLINPHFVHHLTLG